MNKPKGFFEADGAKFFFYLMAVAIVTAVVGPLVVRALDYYKIFAVGG